MIYMRPSYRRGFSRTRKIANWEKPNLDGSRTEAVEQVQVVQWISEHLPDICYTASPAGIKTDYGTAKKLKRMGYVAGCPDLIFAEARKGYHGLFIEMKREKDYQTSEAQKDFLKKLNDRGYLAVVCPGYDEAVKVLKDYFDGEYRKSALE